jgi:hypothetical protein
MVKINTSGHVDLFPEVRFQRTYSPLRRPQRPGLFQPFKHFWSLDLIMAFGEDWRLWTCLYSVFFALVLSVESGKLLLLEWWWLGVFIAPTNILAVGWVLCRWAHQTVRCALNTALLTVRCDLDYGIWRGLKALNVPHQPTVGVWSRWPLKSSVLVVHRTVRCDLTSRTIPDLWRFRLRPQSTVGKVDHCFVGSPDSPVIFSRGALKIPESDQFAGCSSLGTGHCPMHTGQSSAPQAGANLFFSKLIELPQGHFSCMYTWTLCTWEKIN